tara:strand:+ start:4806 stop:5990 length:1185 start_codon:yes stop_codon:yes gene_type:complete
MPVSTGSDTRMYAPRSESNLGYTKDPEDNPHGIGDPETMEQERDKRMAEKEAHRTVTDLPHLQLDVPNDNPTPPPPPPPPPGMAEEEEPAMDDDNENARGAEVSQLTGMPDTGNLSIGAATGTKPGAGGQLVNMSEPMDDAWSSLLKARKNLKNMGTSSVTPWKQPQYKIQPGGADISTATSRRSKLHSRHLQPHKHRGLDRAPLSVHRSHLGIATKQPLRLFPQKYGQQMGSMSRRKWQGNIPSAHPSGHAMGPETTYSPKAPKIAASAGLNIRSPTGPKLQGQNMGIKNTMKSEDIAGIKEDLTLLRKEMSYMHFAQMRRLMRKIKEAMADKERRLKAAVSSGPGEKGKAGHMEGQDKTTRPTGATEDLKNIPESWGAPSTLFAAPGSGRVA